MTTTQTLTFAQRIAALRVTREAPSWRPDLYKIRPLGLRSFAVPEKLTRHRERFVMRGGVLYTRPQEKKAAVFPVTAAAAKISITLKAGERLTPDKCQQLIQKALETDPAKIQSPAVPKARRATDAEIAAYQKAEEALLAWGEQKMESHLVKQQAWATKSLKEFQLDASRAQERLNKATGAVAKFRSERGLLSV